MKVTNQMIRNNWILLLITIIVGFIMIASFILLSGKLFARSSTEDYYQYNADQMMNQIRLEVDSRVEEIQYDREQLINREIENIEEKVRQVYYALLAADLHLESDLDKRKTQAVKMVEDIVEHDEHYLYFAIEAEGTMLRSGTDDKIEGSNLYDVQDSRGQYYIRDIVAAANEPEGLLVDYYWPKELGGEPLPKTSFCFYMPEFDFIIGTGIYHDDLDQALQSKVFERLQRYYENKENYMFVNDYDSTALVVGNPDLLGQKVDEAVDFDGKSIHGSFMDILNDHESGFAQYKYFPRGGDVLTEKISYVRKIDEWQVYIGMGFYVDDLNNQVADYNQSFEGYQYNQLIYIVIGFLLLVIVVFAIFQRGAFLQQRYLKQGDVVFKELFELSNDGVLVLGQEGKILYKNELVERIFHGELDNQIEEGLLKLELVEKDIYKYTSSRGREYYLTLRIEQVTYENQESMLHMLHDVTIQYTQESRLKSMAFLDELTGLPNRRSLMNKFEDILYDIKVDNQVVIGIIDIDNFKKVNDTHGHAEGDEVLKKLAQVFTEHIRQTDGFYRLGGEEFVVLLQDVALEDAQTILMKINRYFYKECQAKFAYGVSFSGGITAIGGESGCAPLEYYLKLSDQLLYKAKDNGRNQIVY